MAKIQKKAISPEQKRLRYQEIMEVTDQLFHEHTYHEITLTVIAEKLGWSRGNLYKYVNTKEEIFLSLYLVKQKEFIETFEEQINNQEIVPNELFAEAMSIAFKKNLDYLKYHSMMTIILETNVSIEKLAEFKKQSYLDRKVIFQYLAQQRHFEDDSQLIQFFLTILYHGCGLYALVECTDNYIKAMELAELPVQKIDFVDKFKSFILMCIQSQMI